MTAVLPPDGTPGERLILIALVFLVAAVISFAGRMAVLVYHEHGNVRILQEAEHLSTDTIGLTTALARERGFTMALLGTPHGQRETLRLRVQDVRNRTDARWQRLAARIDSMADALPGHDRSLPARGDALREHYERIVAFRARIDAQSADVSHDTWFTAATEAIAAAYSLGLVIPVPVPRELLPVERSRRARELSWMLSEYSGRERGLLAYYISAGRPLPEAERSRADHFAAMITHYTAELERQLGDHALPPGVAKAFADMHEQFHESFADERQAVHHAVQSGAYPLGGLQWVERSTHAIDSVIGVSEAISRAMEDALGPVAQRYRRDLSVSVIIVVLVCAAAVLTALRVRRVAARLFEQQRLVEITLGSIGDGVITTDGAGRVDFLNASAQRMTGWRLNEACGKPFEAVFPLVNRFTGEPEAPAAQLCMRNGRVVSGGYEHLVVRHDGSEVPVFHSTAPIHDPEGGIAGTVTVFYDLLDSWSEQHLLSYHSTHDTLTGLTNRGEFERRVEALTSHPRDDGEPYAICYLDIDQFKVVNDTCGHPAGDMLIKELVSTLRRRIRETDLFARLGGDAFGILMKGCPAEKAVEVAESLRAAAADTRFSYGGHNFPVTISVGVVPMTDNEQTAPQLLALADAACFIAKEKGRNQVHLYQSDDSHMSRRHNDMMWVARLQKALECDEFELYCQPIVRVADHSLFAVEILLRLHQPETVIVSPGAFIPAAERFGMMNSIDRWVISRTFTRLAAQPCVPDSPGPLYSINLSGPSLGNPATADYIEEQFAEHGTDPGRICFEITETAAIGNFKIAHDLLTRLRAMGCKVALDDFGTGLSSFAYLRDLPIDFIKMGGGFIRNMCCDRKHAAMVEATQSVARAMDLPMIAESMETREVEAVLRRMGIEFMQGYGIARPMAFDRFLAGRGPKTVNG